MAESLPPEYEAKCAVGVSDGPVPRQPNSPWVVGGIMFSGWDEYARPLSYCSCVYIG